jgi:hypothetical protein
MSEASGQTIGDALSFEPVTAPVAQPPEVGSQPPAQVLLPPPPQLAVGPVLAAAELINGVDLSRKVKALIFAEPGAGKTVFAATAPKPLIIDAENSTEVLGDWPELLAEAKIVRMKKWEALDSILQAIQGGDPAYADRETIVIDTVSELQRRNLDELLDSKASIDSSRSRFLAHQQDYKQSGEMMRRIVTAFRDVDMHLIVLAHAREVNDDGRLVLRPDLTPKLQDTMRGIFGIQGFLFEMNDDWNAPFKNALQTRSNAVVQAKSRYRFLPPVVENPTFQTILDAAHHRYQESTTTDNQQGVTS